VDVLLTIGDFATVTYLGIKALRHYHRIGLLVPAGVGPQTGYRRYRAGQVPAGQVIRRLRDLGMPLEDVQAVLDAPDPAARNAGLGAHLRRMEHQLEQAQATVAPLRRLLEQPPRAVAVEYRAARPARVLALRSQVAMNDAGQWWSGAFDQLHAAVAAGGLARSGADSALYSPGFFQADSGEVTAFIPVAGEVRRAGRPLRLLDLPGAELAVAVHRGPFSDLDTTYAALGGLVAERAIGDHGPIRENYPVTAYDTADEARHQAEVCWPIFLTTARSSR